MVRRFTINFLISTGRRDQDHRRRAIRRRIILRIVVSREREQRPLTRITVTQPRAAHTSSSTCTPFNQRARVPRLPRPVLARGSHRQSNCCSAALRGQRSPLYRCSLRPQCRPVSRSEGWPPRLTRTRRACSQRARVGPGVILFPHGRRAIVSTGGVGPTEPIGGRTRGATEEVPRHIALCSSSSFSCC